MAFDVRECQSERKRKPCRVGNGGGAADRKRLRIISAKNSEGPNPRSASGVE
jgi:hypothetical protein